jgi:hypothetical protein
MKHFDHTSQQTLCDDYLFHQLTEAGRVELRAITPDGLVSWGVFDNLPDLTAAIEQHRRKAHLYTTVQAPKVMTAPNRMTTGRGATRNPDIAQFIRIVFDFDAIRPKGTRATELQIEYTRDAAVGLRLWLTRQGWPLPVVIRSGNGHHLIYRLAPTANTPEFIALLKRIYSGLADDFSSDAVDFDVSVRSPGQIMRLPGSLNFKGDPSNPVPVTITDVPPVWNQVQRRDLTALGRYYEAIEPARVTTSPHPMSNTAGSTRTFTGSGDYSTLNVVDWFTAHGHYIAYLEENKHTVQCPWSDGHTTDSPPTGSDSIIFTADHSWPGFYCHHQGCEGRDIRDVLQLWGDADSFCLREFTPGEVQ